MVQEYASICLQLTNYTQLKLWSSKNIINHTFMKIHFTFSKTIFYFNLQLNDHFPLSISVLQSYLCVLYSIVHQTEQSQEISIKTMRNT